MILLRDAGTRKSSAEQRGENAIDLARVSSRKLIMEGETSVRPSGL